MLVLLFGLLTGLAQAANPVAYDDSVYLSHHGLLRIDVPTLRLRWQVQSEYTEGEPVVSGDTVLLGNSRGLHAFAVNDGALRWQRPSSSRVFTPSVDAKRVYAGREDGHLQAINLTDGRLLWQRQFEGWVYAPVTTGQALIIAGQEPLVRALNPNNGATLWEYPLAQESVHHPVLVDAESVIITTFSGAVMALSVASGELCWLIQDRSPNHSPIVSSAVSPAVLYFRTFAGPIVARSSQDGRELWRSTQALSDRSLTRAANTLLAVDQYGAVLALASSNGSLLRRYLGPGELIGTPLTSNGRLLFFRDASGASYWPQLTVIPWSSTAIEERKL